MNTSIANRTTPKHITASLKDNNAIEKFISTHEETHIGESLELLIKKPRSEQYREEIIGEGACSKYYTTTRHWFDCEFDRVQLSQQQTDLIFDRMIKEKEQTVIKYDNKTEEAYHQIEQCDKILEELKHVKEKGFWWKLLNSRDVERYEKTFNEKLNNIKLAGEYSIKAMHAKLHLSTFKQAVTARKFNK